MELDIAGWRITVDGDAKGGWIIDIHDGRNTATYSPEADSAEEAKAAAVKAHTETFHCNTGAQQSSHPTSADGDSGAGSEAVATQQANGAQASEDVSKPSP